MRFVKALLLLVTVALLLAPPASAQAKSSAAMTPELTAAKSALAKYTDPIAAA